MTVHDIKAYQVLAYTNDTDVPHDEVAEWLRRWTANPLGSARVGSNPILVEEFFNFKNRFFTICRAIYGVKGGRGVSISKI